MEKTEKGLQDFYSLIIITRGITSQTLLKRSNTSPDRVGTETTLLGSYDVVSISGILCCNIDSFLFFTL